jgi:hypothetical protein
MDPAASRRIVGKQVASCLRVHLGAVVLVIAETMMSVGFSMAKECRRGRPIGQYSSEGKT